MNRKAIMLKFLVSVILALIIFVPACLFTSNFFQISKQAENNFGDFLEEFQEMNKAQEGQRDLSVLILDKGTMVAYFEKGQPFVKVDVGADCITCSNYYFLVMKPTSCTDESCLCLLSDIEDNIATVQTKNNFLLEAKQSRCENVASNYKLRSCSIGRSDGASYYSCSNGFMIEREVVKEASWQVTSYFVTPRRNPIQMTKENGKIILEG